MGVLDVPGLPKSQADARYDAIGAAAALDVGGATILGKSVLRSTDAATARSAIGAAAVTTNQELVAGDNIVITSATNLTLGSIYGEQVLQPSMPRYAVRDASVATLTGNLRLSYFTANRSATFSNIRAVSGSTAAAATPTLVRFGVYSIDSSGNLTLIGSTASDTTLFAATGTPYPKALTASVSLAAGARYALALLVVTSATAPTVHGMVMLNAAEAAISERLCGNVASQTDLPATVTSGAVSATTSNPYIALQP